MNFTPHETYEGLRIQARAMASLCAGRERDLDRITAELRAEKAKKRHVSQDELDSERAANERLTKDVEWLETRLSCEDLGEQVVALRRENETMRALLLRVRGDPNLWRAGRAGGQDQYAGMPPFCRLIDATLKLPWTG